MGILDIANKTAETITAGEKKESKALDNLRSIDKDTMLQVIEVAKKTGIEKNRSIRYCLQSIFSAHLKSEGLIESAEVERDYKILKTKKDENGNAVYEVDENGKKSRKTQKETVTETRKESFITSNQVDAVLKHFNLYIENDKVMEGK